MEKKNVLNDPKVRSLFFQVVIFLTVLILGVGLFKETQLNLEKQNIASGFDFLKKEAGFEIGESLIEYLPSDTYAKALIVGLINTLKVAVIGNVLAVFLGIILGIARLSKNFLISSFTKSYIEIVRNTPLLLQLFLWYAIITESFPSVKAAHNFFDLIYICNRGFFFPSIVGNSGLTMILSGLAIALVGSFVSAYCSKKKQERTGQQYPVLAINIALFILVPTLLYFFFGESLQFDLPELAGFNFRGGMSFSPEFSALLLGLVFYTSAFNAEIVRAGIQSVNHGQWEAAASLALSPYRTMKLVILPQAMRVIIPPLTSQILNLTKNSSLAVAIGFPDFVSVANTTMNQTGQAIEAVALIMLCYLVISLSTSFVMNSYNKAKALRER